MNYGIPYMGSKSKICNFVASYLPSNDNFYDLFGGGFSVTHYLLIHRPNHFKNFHFNEIREGAIEFIQDAMNGKYNIERNPPKFITREEFEREKEKDFYTKIIWSFGNNGKSYMFGRDIEKQKESLHNAVVFGIFDDFAKKIFGSDKLKIDGVKNRRIFLRSKIQQLQQLQQLQRLERLEQFQQFERLERLERLEQVSKNIIFSKKSYEEVEIKSNSTVYCDPPYINTAGYDSEFNHKEFYDWADSQAEPVFISEYRLDDSRFKCIAQKEKRSTLSATANNSVMEKIFVNRKGYEKIMDIASSRKKNNAKQN